MYKRKEEEPPCDVCLPPLDPDNEDAAAVYFTVQSQVITVGMGDVIDLNISAVLDVIDLYGIADRKNCLNRVLTVFRKLLEEKREKR